MNLKENHDYQSKVGKLCLAIERNIAVKKEYDARLK
jgi:hypothetical protein